MLLIPRTILGGGGDRLQHEALREEVHRFDENDYTLFTPKS